MNLAEIVSTLFAAEADLTMRRKVAEVIGWKVVEDIETDGVTPLWRLEPPAHWDEFWNPDTTYHKTEQEAVSDLPEYELSPCLVPEMVAFLGEKLPKDGVVGLWLETGTGTWCLSAITRAEVSPPNQQGATANLALCHAILSTKEQVAP